MKTPATLPAAPAALRLFTYFRSSASYRVRIALNLKRLQYEAVYRHLRYDEHLAPDHLSLNPEGLLPVLQHGDVTLTQSLAIIEYLDERFPEPRLLPVEPAARAQARALALSIACEIHAPTNLRVTRYLKSELGQDQDSLAAWSRHWMQVGFKALEARAAVTSSGRRYLLGDSVTIADLCLVPQMYNARRQKVDLSPFPALVAISNHLESLAPFAAAAPEAQPDCDI
ncbi:MAG: maleylacetoacetate isomerase [Steroidobacteraceae bacterium]